MRNLLLWFRERISFRKIVILAGILLLTAAFSQVFSLDMAFMFAGDTMAYYELFAAVGMIAFRGHVRLVLEVSKHRIQQSWRSAAMHFRRGRIRETLTRACRALLPPKADDEDGAPVFA
jgi:hypothetical protein